MKDSPIRHRFEFALYSAVKGTLQHLPAPISRGLGRGLGRIAHRLLTRDRELARDNLARALPELSEGECRRTIARAYRNYGDTLALTFLAESKPWVEAHVPIQGAEHLRAAAERGKGLILVGGHLGYWELSALRAGLELGRLHVVYRPLDNPHLDRDIVRLRDRFGIQLVPKRGAASPLLRALRRGEAIGLLPDQRVPAHQGLVVPFLGRPAMTTTLPAALTLRTGCAVLPICCLPDADGGCVVRIDPPLDTEVGPEEIERAREFLPPEATPEEAERAALTVRLMAPLEREIRARPDRWLWAHRRWKLDPPPGESPPA